MLESASCLRMISRKPGLLLGACLITAVAAGGCSASSGGGAPAAGRGGAAAGGTAGASGGKAAAADGKGANTEADAIAIQVAPVRREALSSLYATSATLRADKQATVTARTRGVIRKLVVEEGSTVAPDGPLAYLEDEEQRINFDRARTSHDTKQREYERARNLHSQGLVSDEEFETRRREAEDAQQAALLAELTLSRTVIRAPFGGLIVKRYLDPGATVSDGAAVYDLADLDPLYADINVPERHVARLAVGQTVRLVADASQEVVRARIERIGPAVDPATGTVKVTVAAPGSTRLRPGAFARVDIVTDTHTAALVVPRSALVAEGRRWHIFRLDETGKKVKQVEVKLGFEEGDRVELLEVAAGAAPLPPGTLVVTVGAPSLTDGAPVRVIEEKGGKDAGKKAELLVPDEPHVAA